MKTTFLARLIVLAVAFAGAVVPAQSPASDPGEIASQSDPRTDWWRKARFGMFIHWDMSSVAGTEIRWSRKGSRPLDNGGDPAGYVADPIYDNLYREFNPTRFDAQAWVRLATEESRRLHK